MDTFEEIVVDVLDNLPEQFARVFENVEVLVEPRLTPVVRRTYDLGRHETVYGLYIGVPLPERDWQGVYEPDIIVIFQEPLERDFPQPEQLKREIRGTVLHEIAHHFGISDDRLRELGVY